MNAARFPFLGLHMHALDLAGAIDAVRQAAGSDHFGYVVTPNAAHFARLGGDDAALLPVYQGATLCLLDSRAIALAGRLAGLRTPPVVTGADLVAGLFRSAIGPSTSLCIIGASPASVEALRAKFGLCQVSHFAPPMGFWRDEAECARAARFAAASRADYTFLVVGSPQQERLAARIAATPGARGIGICAGAAIEFLTGAQRRAPRLVQRAALEWAWRLLADPRRLAHRYCVESPQALRLVLRQARAEARP